MLMRYRPARKLYVLGWGVCRAVRIPFCLAGLECLFSTPPEAIDRPGRGLACKFEN